MDTLLLYAVPHIHNTICRPKKLKQLQKADRVITAKEGEGSKRKREKEAIVDEDEESAVSAIDSVVYEDESDLDEVYESDTDSKAGGKKDVTFTSTSTTALPQGQDLLDIMSRQSRSEAEIKQAAQFARELGKPTRHRVSWGPHAPIFEINKSA